MSRRFPWLADLAQDLRFAVHSLMRTPGFAVVTMLTIAVGVGATTTVFSAMNALLLRPLPVAQPDRLFALDEQREGDGLRDNGYNATRWERYLAYKEALIDVFSDLAVQRRRVLRCGPETGRSRQGAFSFPRTTSTSWVCVLNAAVSSHPMTNPSWC